MERAVFKKEGNYLGFNSQNADMIFWIVEEKEEGYIYFQAGKPFGPLNFVYKAHVLEEKEEVTEEAKDGKSKNS